MPAFLANGGEMGLLINAQDWRGTALGPPANWPTTLKIMLATLLSSPQPMIMGWGPGFLSFFNDSYRQMLGSRFQGLSGVPAAEKWTDSWAEIEPIAQKALGGEGAYYEDMPLTLTRKGYREPTWWRLSFLPFRDETGQVPGVYCLLVETTEKRLAEQRKAQAQKQQAFQVDISDALRDALEPEPMMMLASQKLGQYLNAACVGYAEVGETGEWSALMPMWTDGKYSSPAGSHRLDAYGAALLAELRSGRTVAINDTTVDPLTPAAACEASDKPVRACAFMGSPHIVNNRLAMVLFVVDSRSRVWLDCEKTLIEEVAARTWISQRRLLAEKNLRLTNAMLEQRTTELLRSETALRQSQKLEALGQLTGGVAHDFNNLLAVINSSVELLRSHRLPAEHCDYYLELIHDTVGRAVKLTGQLLAFARQQPLIPEVFDVDRQVQSVIDLVKPLLGSRIEILHQSCLQEGCFALADVNQFETALLNLAVNARDAMNASGQFVIAVQKVDRIPAGPSRGHRQGEFIAISASDTGCGIALEKLEAIFEPFYTTKEAGRGTGLGLSQVFGFAKQSGGEVNVRSEPGKGSVFTLYLPRAERVAESQAAAPAPEPAMSCQGIGVLVVEDNEALGQIACEILELLDYRPVWAASAAAALRLLADDAGRFGLVFSDVVMPGMDGFEFGEQVRREYPGLPVVLTSGYNSVMAQQEHHAFKLVLKPYTSDTLARVFRQSVAEHKPTVFLPPGTTG
ncbi:two-component hybrid sensor and regulator [Polaromonas sp. CG9_12]|nr:two-component hybrid sensor and regulator [Polaromonas sp. CG9_12]